MRICSGPGCLRVVSDYVKFCDDCKPSSTIATDDIRTHTTGYDAELDRLRKGLRWQRTRKAIVMRNPLCQRCELRITEEVDHIVPAREAIAQARASGLYVTDRNAGYYLRTNLQGLCILCHRTKTIEDKAHTGPWPDVIARELAAPKRRYSF